MPEIVVALESGQEWIDFTNGVHRKSPKFPIAVTGTYWRAADGAWPTIAAGERVWLCWGTIIRGHAPLLRLITHGQGKVSEGTVELDLRQFRPQTFPFRFRDNFSRGWRYLLLREGQKPLPFDDWEWAGGWQRRQQVLYRKELAAQQRSEARA
jgi:hypothetical protein